MNPGKFVCILATLFLSSAWFAAGFSGELGMPELGSVLYCLNTKLNTIGYAPPHFATHSFRVRYVLGVVDKSTDDKNELHLVVYGREEKKANLYEVYFDRDGRPSIYIGEMGTLKQEKGMMEPDEIWGGVGTYRRVKQLLRVVSDKPAITVSDDQVTAGQRSCVFER